LRHSRAGRSAGDKGFFNEIIVGARFRKNHAKYRFVLPIIFAGRSKWAGGELRRLECASMVSSKSAQTETTSR